MKLTSKLFPLVAVIVATFCTGANAQESRRGLYEAALPSNGGEIVFFVHTNHLISAHLFDLADKEAAFTTGQIKTDGTFSLKLNSTTTVAGTVAKSTITATVNGGTSLSAARTPIFGNSEGLAGRYVGDARSTNGRFDVRLIIDSQNNIFLIEKNAANVQGGYGTVTVQNSTTTDPTSSEEADQADTMNEDPNQPASHATFTLTMVSGESVTGTLVYGHGELLADYTVSGVTYHLRAERDSIADHMANISTRGFVNTGDGQLIGGFIVTGGPKTVMVRAVGPSLTKTGVTDALADPVLSLMSGSTQVAQNDNWQQAPNAADMTASKIAPSDPNESAILMRLEPGAYTAVVTGANQTTGVALIEVYEVDRD